MTKATKLLTALPQPQRQSLMTLAKEVSFPEDVHIFEAGGTADRFWVIPHQDFLDIAIARWETIGEQVDPEPAEHVPGMPPRSQMIAEVMAALGTSEPS